MRILDISLRGSRVAHDEPLPVGTTCLLQFQWHECPIEAWCEIVRSRLHAFARAGHAEFHTGLRIVEAVNGSAPFLREMICWHVTRALDAQIADAHGEPPPPDLEAPEVERVFIRCEMVRGMWRRVTTADPQQPSIGFTVRASEPPKNIDRLIRTYEGSDTETRKLIQRIAAVSLGNDSELPHRSYEP